MLIKYENYAWKTWFNNYELFAWIVAYISYHEIRYPDIMACERERIFNEIDKNRFQGDKK